MKAEEFYKNHELKDELSFSQLTSTGISTNYNQVFAFAEAYYQSRVNNSEYVVELSDDEIKIVSESELQQWKKEALEFDGFEGWIVRGKLLKQ